MFLESIPFPEKNVKNFWKKNIFCLYSRIRWSKIMHNPIRILDSPDFWYPYFAEHWQYVSTMTPFFSLGELRVRISSTFSVLRPFSYLRPVLYFDRSTSTFLLRPIYFDSLTWTSVLRHFVKSGVEKYRSKYSFGRSK